MQSTGIGMHFSLGMRMHKRQTWIVRRRASQLIKGLTMVGPVPKPGSRIIPLATFDCS